MGRAVPKSILPVIAFVGVVVFVASSGCWDEPQGPVADGDGAMALIPQFGGGGATLKSPVRLAVLSSGELVVTDSRQNAVLTVDPATLLPVQQVDINGRPLGVGYLGNRLLVGNATTKNVELYDSRGRLRGALGHAEKPTDLAVDQGAGLVFVLDAGRSEVVVFDRRGRLLNRISGPGTGPSELLLPMSIAVDPGLQEVYVTDFGDPDNGHAAIKIFDYQGQFVDAISGEGNCGLLGCSGGFSRPQGMVADGQGQIFLADALLAQVLVFDRTTLKVVRTLGGRGVGSVTLRVPLDVAIGLDGDVFVTSNRTGTVEVFRGGVSP